MYWYANKFKDMLTDISKYLIFFFYITCSKLSRSYYYPTNGLFHIMYKTDHEILQIHEIVHTKQIKIRWFTLLFLRIICQACFNIILIILNFFLIKISIDSYIFKEIIWKVTLSSKYFIMYFVRQILFLWTQN